MIHVLPPSSLLPGTDGLVILKEHHRQLLAVGLGKPRQRYATLRLHYDEARRQIGELKYRLAFLRKSLGWEPEEDSTLLGYEGHIIDTVLLGLLTLVHPDRWCQGQPASLLVHELAVAINAQRERLAGT